MVSQSLQLLCVRSVEVMSSFLSFVIMSVLLLLAMIRSIVKSFKILVVANEQVVHVLWRSSTVSTDVA